ncbi:MAG TPA: MarR family transcriptional regulator [Solirubrobacteraceae bacterium]|jgi:DNA-binding MarR family transcriptional regulator
MSTALPTEPTPTLARFNEAWDHFFGAVRRARGRAQRIPEGPGELSLAQYQLLLALHGGAALPVGELAVRGGVSGPTATRALDALARRGIVEREHSAADRRVVTVRLTEAGEQALARKRDFILGKRAELFAELDPDEREQAQRLLRRLAELIDTW